MDFGLTGSASKLIHLNQILFVCFVLDQSWIFVFRKSSMLGFLFSRGQKERKGKDKEMAKEEKDGMEWAREEIRR